MGVRTILRRPAVMAALGYSGTQLDDLVKKGVLPAPVKLSDGGRAVGWFADEVAAFQQARAEARDRERAAKVHAKPPKRRAAR